MPPHLVSLDLITIMKFLIMQSVQHAATSSLLGHVGYRSESAHRGYCAPIIFIKFPDTVSKVFTASLHEQNTC
jgi:hypothetical protein